MLSLAWQLLAVAGAGLGAGRLVGCFGCWWYLRKLTRLLLGVLKVVWWLLARRQGAGPGAVEISHAGSFLVLQSLPWVDQATTFGGLQLS